ncbi:MAG: hypothetical protein PUH33_03305, partial [Clostridiaceae bacterium]|nr:hypothetical protein [Clostridiaceae bacterium]
KQSYFRRLVSKPSYSAGVIDYRFSGNRAGRRDWDDVGIVPYAFHRENDCFLFPILRHGFAVPPPLPKEANVKFGFLLWAP